MSTGSPSTGGSFARRSAEATSTATSITGPPFTVTRTLRTNCTSPTPGIARNPSPSDAGKTKVRAVRFCAVVTNKSGLRAMRIQSANES